MHTKLFLFLINISWLPWSCTSLSCVLFRNRWYFSTLLPLWFTCDKLHNIIWRHLHIPSNAPLNRLPVPTTNTDTMVNDNTNSSKTNWLLIVFWYLLLWAVLITVLSHTYCWVGSILVDYYVAMFQGGIFQDALYKMWWWLAKKNVILVS